MCIQNLEQGSLTRRIKAEALRLGFAQTGIARAGATPHATAFRDWLRDGFHGEMRYLERQADKRADPDRVLTGVRSIIVTALGYHPYTDSADATDGLRGRISRYACGADYHDVVKMRLAHLFAYIKGEVPGVRGVCHVDTGPVAEKVWGAETSVGWMGKHTGLVSRRLGSRFFLGVILLDIPLDYDDKNEGFCGNCRRCLEACPTGALVAPYRLDARRCLSYLTIEFRGVIPRELRPLVGRRIFGCDECHDACPWNRFAARMSADELAPQAGNLSPELPSLAGLSRAEFDRRFAGSPVHRATRDGFVRNVAVALGNSAREEAVPTLASLLRDESPLVRIHAVWAIGHIMRGRSRAILEAAREKETDAGVLAEIACATS